MAGVLRMRSYRTYEEWKRTWVDNLYRKILFLPYLWGMETTDCGHPQLLRCVCSYRTYEEWKLFVYSYKLTDKQFVLTVPMRNGNASLYLLHHPGIPFLPYLWGMETSNPQAVWYSLRVLTVPMRNGNTAPVVLLTQITGVLTVPMRNGNLFASLCGTPSLSVLTVPMRNGNDTQVGNWHRLSVMFLPYLWGMETAGGTIVAEVPVAGSYRTYEEWKLLYRWYVRQSGWVLTVPMRNGNNMTRTELI